MDSSESQFLFKETRVNLEPPSHSSVVTVRVPAGRAPSRRKQTSDNDTEDETTFRTKNLATASSIYHRKHHDFPRSFLWRVLDDGTTLSIRTVDLCRKDKSTPDAPLVLNFSFATPLLPNCIALADPEEHDVLCVFVLDQAHVLWTFTLRPDLFRKKTAVDAGLSEVAKRHAPTGLSFKHPHRLEAVSANMLLVTVNDGGMMRFDRAHPDEGAQSPWRENFFNVQGWKQNLRSLLPFQGKHTIRYGKVNMEYSAATAIQTTDLGIEDTLYAVTICLDHRMRIWNLEDGQILHTGDILDVDRPPQDVGKWAIDPAQSNLVRLAGLHRGQRICVTYSPIGAGEFKFWKIIAKDTHTLVVDDMYPSEHFVPVTPSSSDVWTLADFTLANPRPNEIVMWTLWKNNMTYKVQRLPLESKHMADRWNDSWDSVYADNTVSVPSTSGPCDPVDVTEKWLETILQPGRFTKATLTTALSIYEQGLGAPKDSNKGRGIAEAICTVLGSTASLERGSSGSVNYEQFRTSSETQWRRFYRLLVELDRQRGEALALAVDVMGDLTWVACTDCVSTVSYCNPMEELYYNLSRPKEDQEKQAAVISSAVTFVEGFSDNILQTCEAVLRPELFEESSKTDLERIQYFSDKSGFWRGITDEDCAQIVDVLGQNFTTVTDQLYQEVLSLVAAPENTKRRKLQHPLSDFGRKLTMKAVQENIELYWKVCFSQLILLVHMEFEFDNDEDALHNRVDIGSVYRQLVGVLRRLELLKWLSNTETSIPTLRPDKGASSAPTKKAAEDMQIVTALESKVGHLLGFAPVGDVSLSDNIVDLVSSLCAPDSDIEISPPLIQCSLIRQERADLALDLAPFCDQEPFSVYVQGRVFLALKDFDTATTSFRKAAIGMSKYNHYTSNYFHSQDLGAENFKMDRHSSGLLDETEWNLLNCGQARYYSHVVALFERYRAYSYVVEFARLAIQFLGQQPENNLTKTDMFSRLFNAAVATSQFSLAHTTLVALQDSALRHSSLRKLVDKMCETYHNLELVALPFPGMQQEVDEILAQRCKKEMDVVSGFPYHQVLYSWRTRRGNFRGAAAILLDRIQKLKLAGEGDRLAGDDVLDTSVTKQYLLLINALSCVEKKEAWVYDEGVQHGETPAKRKVVSLADIRKQYQDELDRIAAIQNNQFGFEADDVMDIS